MEGKVLEARAFKLPTRSAAEDNSSKAEAETITQALLALARLAPNLDTAALSTKAAKASLFTDSNATVMAHRAFVLQDPTPSQKAKSDMTHRMLEMRRAYEWLQEEYGITVTIAHDYNEHGRKWNNTNREHLTCRGNRACDRAAERASKKTKPAWYDVDARRKPQKQGQGGPVAWSVNGQLWEGDLKRPITEKVYTAWQRHLEKMGIEGRVARAVQAGEVSEKATALAWKLLQDDEWEEVVRGLLQRHPATMPELNKTAEGDKNDRLLAKVLSACGESKTKCSGATTLPSAENTQTAGTTRAGSARARPVRQREAQSKHAKPSGLRGAGPCGRPTQSTPTARPSKANEELSPTPAGHCHHQISNHTASSQTAPSTRWTRQRQSRVPPQVPRHASPPT